MISDQESFVFFRSKIRCAVAQIKAKGCRVSISSYWLTKNRRLDTWETSFDGPENERPHHPLGFFIENQRILRDKSKIASVSRRLGCKIEHLEYFLHGLKGESEYAILDRINRKDLKFKFFALGKEIRLEAKAKAKKESMEAMFLDTYQEDLMTYDYVSLVTFMCSECGAVVRNKGTHYEWHIRHK